MLYTYDTSDIYLPYILELQYIYNIYIYNHTCTIQTYTIYPHIHIQ